MLRNVMADLIRHLLLGLSFWHGDLMMCKAICKLLFVKNAPVWCGIMSSYKTPTIRWNFCVVCHFVVKTEIVLIKSV